VTEGPAARADQGAVLVIYGGDFITFAPSSVLLCGTSKTYGFTYVFGGKFYNLGNNANFISNLTSADFGNFYIWGGTFCNQADTDANLMGGTWNKVGATNITVAEQKPASQMYDYDYTGDGVADSVQIKHITTINV
jgi:hypothetical protein